jgi:transcriptional regulator with XRE-family HTH domain
MKKELKKAFSITLKDYRKKKNLSQEELALRAGMTRSHISDLERGDIDPGFYTIFKISNALNVKTSHFIDAIEHAL